MRVAFALLLSLCAWAQGPPGDEVGRLLRQIDDEDVNVREEATVRLMELGKPVEAALREAEKTGSPEARERIHRVLDYLAWDLPPALAPSLQQRLDGLSGVDPSARLAEVVAIDQDLGTVPGGSSAFLACAWDRETDEKARQVISEMLSQSSGGVAALATRILSRGPSALPRLRNALAVLPSSDPPANREASVAVCSLLARNGLGDLATLPMAERLLDGLDHEVESERHARAAEALEADGAPWEAILEYRRASVLRPGLVGGLDALCEKQGCGAAHLALLRWLEHAPLPAAAASEVVAARAKWEARAAKGGQPEVDLSKALRLRGWFALPFTPHRLIGDRAVYVGGARPDRPQYPNVAAFDRDTGALRWLYRPAEEPNSTLQMPIGGAPSLSELRDGVLVRQDVESHLGEGGTLGRTALRMRLTRLSRDGKPVWTREFDPCPGVMCEVLGDSLVALLPSPSQYRGRAWVARLDDGRVASTFPLLARAVPIPDGRLLIDGGSASATRLLDPLKGRDVWSREYAEVQIGVGDRCYYVEGESIYMTTGRHALRLDRKDGGARWVHAFDADETTLGVAARREEAYVVLDSGGGNWKVVSLRASNGAETGSFERPCGDTEDPGSKTCRWIADDVFLCHGRLVDVSEKLVLHTGLLNGEVVAEPLPMTGGRVHGFDGSSGEVPEAWLTFQDFAVSVNPALERTSTKRAKATAERLEAAGRNEEAKALCASIAEWDPFTGTGESQDGHK